MARKWEETLASAANLPLSPTLSVLCFWNPLCNSLV